ncbi:hypothetical protein FRC09_008779, partial [Ceratobasidium sp. 395]
NAPTTRAPPPPTQVQTLIPPAISPNATVLLSGIALPLNPVVVCRAWTGPDDGIDAARKYIVDVASGAPDVSAALAALVRPDAELSLWAFSIVSGDAAAPRLAALDFRSHGLRDYTLAMSARPRTSVPVLDPVRPVTHSLCRMRQTPGAHDLPAGPHRPEDQPADPTAAAAPLRILARSLAFPRSRPDIPPALVAHPYRRPYPTRTLTHAHVHISLAHPLPRPSTPTHILVHLLPHATPLTPFPTIANPSPGTAVLLLPSSTPAYALAPYTGPAPHGFLSFLSGRGVQPSSATSPCILIWLPLPPNNQSGAASPPNASVNALPTPSAATPAATAPATGTGARGMYVVWPRALCVVDTSTPSIDVGRLPNLPTNLINTGSTTQAPSKPRRFPTKNPSIPHPIILAQPTQSSQPSSQTQSPSPTTSLSGLANSASTLIDSIVRAREKEKEKKRARMERARSGSAVPIPVPSTLSGASTPTTATTTTAPPLHIQTQTPTGSALHPSPLANTPHHMSPVTHTHPHMSAVSASSTTTAVGGANMSPARSEGFGIGMDLFGDQEGFGSDTTFGVGMDVDAFGIGAGYNTSGPFGSAGGYDTGTTSTLNGGGGPAGPTSVDFLGDLWSEGGVGSSVASGPGTGPVGGEDPKSATMGRREDEDFGALADSEFDIFDSWGGGEPSTIPPSAVPVLDITNLDLGLDFGPSIPSVQMHDPNEVIDLDPTSPVSISSAPTSVPSPTPKPYFPLTPPEDDGYGGAKGEGERKKAGMFDPLRFTQKFEGVDGKYRGVDGKFVFRLGRGGVVDVGSAKMADIWNRKAIEVEDAQMTDLTRVNRPNVPQIQSPPRSWSYTPVGQETLGSTTTLVGRLDRLQVRPRSISHAGYPSAQSLQVASYQASTYAQSPRIPTYTNVYPQYQRGLPTPAPSPSSLRRLRAGYIGLTNPSAKRLRSLRQAHTRTEPKTGPSALSLFAKDWETTAATTTRAPCSPTATLSDADSDSDSDHSDGGMSVAITNGGGGAASSRGASPPLSAITSSGSGTGVPPGPALILAHFRPSVLGSGAVGEVLPWPDPKEPKTPAPGPVSVPTPVSPGGITEVSKATVERAANMLTREAVDNWTWGAEFGAYNGWNSEVCAPSSRAELVLLGTCLAAVGSNMTLQKLTTAPKVDVVSEVLTDRPYPHHPRFEKLRHPKLAVGHSGQVTQMSSAVLRFWETVGLEPVGGTKDVLAFAVFEGGGDSEDERAVKRWLEKVGKVYEARKLGRHQFGESGGKKGVAPVRWENVTDTLYTIVDELPNTQSNLVFYVILPQSAVCAPWFSSMLLKIAGDTFIDSQGCGQSVVVHLVPAAMVFNHHAAPPDSRQQLEYTALSVYDRIQRTVAKRIRRRILHLSFPDHTRVQVPAFTIARTLTPRFRFSMDWPDKHRETMDRHMFLHVAYTFSKSRRWLCAACVDERGEARETKVWRVSLAPEEEDEGELDEESIDQGARMNKYVNLVWHFAMKFAKRAGIEWRVVICRMGAMGVEELEAWNTCMLDSLRDYRTGIHVSVLSFDQSSGLAFATGVAPSIKAQVASVGTPPSVIVDISSNDFLALPGFDTDIRTSPTLDLNADHLSCGLLPLATAHFLRALDPPVTRPPTKGFDTKFDDLPSISISSQLHLLLVAMSRNSSLWKSGGDPWRELLHSFYSLSVLTQARMPSLDPLPFHLAMIVTMANVVDNRDLVPTDSLSDC